MNEINNEIVHAFKHTLASLLAAISLLEKGGKKAAPSDKMFEQMLTDYRNCVERGRRALNEYESGTSSGTELKTVRAERDRAMQACQRLGERLVQMENRHAGDLEELAYLKESHHAMSECIGMYSIGADDVAEKFRKKVNDIYDARLEQVTKKTVNALMDEPVELGFISSRGMGDVSDDTEEDQC